MATPPVRPTESVWAEYKRLGRILFVDALLFLTLLAILLVVFESLKLLELAGYKKEAIEFL